LGLADASALVSTAVLMVFLILVSLVVQGGVAPNLRLISFLDGQERFILSSLIQVWRAHIPFDEFVADTVKADVVDGRELELITGVYDV